MSLPTPRDLLWRVLFVPEGGNDLVVQVLAQDVTHIQALDTARSYHSEQWEDERDDETYGQIFERGRRELERFERLELHTGALIPVEFGTLVIVT